MYFCIDRNAGTWKSIQKSRERGTQMHFRNVRIFFCKMIQSERYKGSIPHEKMSSVYSKSMILFVSTARCTVILVLFYLPRREVLKGK